MDDDFVSTVEKTAPNQIAIDDKSLNVERNGGSVFIHPSDQPLLCANIGIPMVDTVGDEGIYSKSFLTCDKVSIGQSIEIGKKKLRKRMDGKMSGSALELLLEKLEDDIIKRY